MRLQELIENYDQGKLTTPLLIDIDNDRVYVPDKVYPGNEPVFEMHPDDMLPELLTLCGIPWEYA